MKFSYIKDEEFYKSNEKVLNREQTNKIPELWGCSMDIKRNGELVYLEDHCLYDQKGTKIEKLTICIEGDTLLYWGELESVREKYINLIERFRESDADITGIKIIQLYEVMSVEECYFVIEVANTYTDSGFIKTLGEFFMTDKFDRWLSDEKAYKKA